MKRRGRKVLYLFTGELKCFIMLIRTWFEGNSGFSIILVDKRVVYHEIGNGEVK